MKLTNINDYLDALQELFPSVSKKDLKRIVTYGWKQFYLANSYGGDVCIKDSNFWLYSGTLTKDSILQYKRYIRKLTVKLRVLYKRKKIQWDGYYYFALSLDQYSKIFDSVKKKGRPKKYINFGTVYGYKILDECRIKESNKNYIFKIPYPLDLGFKIQLKDLKTDQAELYLKQDNLKFKDILISNNVYEYL